MTARETVARLHVGDKVKCKLNGSIVEHSWFTGIIIYIDRKLNIVNINRDDRNSASSWTTSVTNDNCSYMRLLVGDWDE